MPTRYEKGYGPATSTVTALNEAVPYLRLFRGQTFVVKVGGGALDEPGAVRSLIDQLTTLWELGIRTVLVHGGGARVSAISRALGAEPVFVDGRRVTDAVALEAAICGLNGAVNTRLLAEARRTGLPAVGLSGVDAGLLSARRRAPVAKGDELVDYGFVGDLVEVRPRVLHSLLDAGFAPIVSPIAADEGGHVLNINADTAAAELAVALGAAKLMFLSGAPGILADVADPGTLVPYLDLPGLAELRRKGAIQNGMLPKVAAIERALGGGVARVHVLSYERPGGLLAEIFTNQGVGTLVVASIGSLAPAELDPADELVEAAP